MKIAVMTLHREPNYGTVLQALALCDALSALGHEVDLVDYIRPSRRGARALARQAGQEDGYLVKRLARAFRRTGHARHSWNQGFADFYERHFPFLTRSHCGVMSLREEPPEADLYICGSDQLWNIDYHDGVDPAYLLDFGSDQTPRLSYATSFGTAALPHQYKSQFIQLLRRFVALSVRDDGSLAILQELGLSGQVVVDPTLLLGPGGWQKYASPDSPLRAHSRHDHSPYVLVYSVEEHLNLAASRIAREVGDRLGARTLLVAAPGKLEPIAVDHRIDYATPSDFLRLFQDAKFIVTASFHGTAFAINFQKDFISLAPPKYSGRSESLLSSLSLSERYITCGVSLPNELNIDWERPQRSLAAQVRSSRRFLSDHLALLAQSSGSHQRNTTEKG